MRRGGPGVIPNQLERVLDPRLDGESRAPLGSRDTVQGRTKRSLAGTEANLPGRIGGDV